MNLNNLGEAATLLEPEEWPSSVRYCIYQLECGPAGNLHFQGYLELKRGQRLSFLQRLEGLEGAHWAIRFGHRKICCLFLNFL